MSEHLTALIAPDAYKGSLRSDAVAEAMSSGLRDGGWAGAIDECLVADGGDGTLTALSKSGPGVMDATPVRGPYGEEVLAEWWRCDDGTAVIELARCSGLALTSHRAPLDASSYGTGQLIAHVLSTGVSEILLACGGSATVDGGLGLLAALGVRFFARGGPLAQPRARDLIDLTHLEMPNHLHELPVLVLTDVTNPLLGERGAAAVFGPQKGASPGDVTELERGLSHFAHIVASHSERSIDGLVGGGAAGGVAAGLAGVFGCPLRSGFDEIADRVGLESRLSESHVVLTGEGQIDCQSWSGKTISGVSSRASVLGIMTWAFGGRIDSTASSGRPSMLELVEVTPRDMPFATAVERAPELLKASVSLTTPQIAASCRRAER